MNKAFVRETEDNGERFCPRCGERGIGVRDETLREQLSPAARQLVGETVFYCPAPNCLIGYFDLIERTVPVAELRFPTWPKDLQGPLCRCFDFTFEEIEADLAEGDSRRVRALLAEAAADAAHCTLSMPDGRCCATEVQKSYLRLRGQRQK